MSSSTAFTGFQKLSPGVYLKESSGAPADQPECVLLFSWMNGAPQHIAKYTDAYAKVYPKSSMLLVQSSTGIFIRSAVQNDAELGPAVDWLRKSGLLKTENNRVLVHIMSNGGGIRACNMAKMLKESMATPPVKATRDAPPPKAVHPALPARAYVYDSAPGRTTFQGFMTAFMAPVARASFLKKLPYYIILPIILMLGRVWTLITRRPNALEQQRVELLDPSLFAQKAPKAYIYSNGDELTDAAHVEEHIADAKLIGGPVEAVSIKRSPHVSHMRTDPKRYWEAITEVYKSGS